MREGEEGVLRDGDGPCFPEPFLTEPLILITSIIIGAIEIFLLVTLFFIRSLGLL